MTQLDKCRDTCGLSKWLHFSRTEIARATDIQGTECRLDQFSPSRALSALLNSVLIAGLASKTSNQSMHRNSKRLNRSGENKRLLKSTDFPKNSLQYNMLSILVREVPLRLYWGNVQASISSEWPVARACSWQLVQALHSEAPVLSQRCAIQDLTSSQNDHTIHQNH